MQKAGQPQVLKWYNSSLIQQLILENGPVSKPDLVQLTKLSLPTVNKIVDELVEEGYAKESSVQNATGAGRKAKTYIVDGKFGTIIIAYYLDGKWLGAATNILGEILYRIERSAEESREINQVQILYDLLDDLIGETDRVKAIGIGIPGIVMKNGDITGIPVMKEFEGVNLEKLLKCRYQLPVFVENDVKLMTVGCYKNKIHNWENMIFLYISSGIGAGIMINGQLYKGNTSFAGEFAYMPVADGKGNLEARLSDLRKRMHGEHAENAKMLFAEEISNAVIHCTTIINPEAIILYGNDFDSGLMEVIKERVKEYIPAYSYPEIILTGDDSYGVSGLISMCLDGIHKKCWLLDEVENR